jgi:hypothetical protein
MFVGEQSAPLPAQDLSLLFTQSDTATQQQITALIAEFQNLLSRNFYKKEEEIKKQQQMREQQRQVTHTHTHTHSFNRIDQN